MSDYSVEVQVDGEKMWEHDYARNAENAIKAFIDWAG